MRSLVPFLPVVRSSRGAPRHVVVRPTPEPRPCDAPAYRQVECRIGQWDDFVNGEPSGRDLVTLEQDGRLATEDVSDTLSRGTKSVRSPRKGKQLAEVSRDLRTTWSVAGNPDDVTRERRH